MILGRGGEMGTTQTETLYTLQEMSGGCASTATSLPEEKS